MNCKIYKHQNASSNAWNTVFLQWMSGNNNWQLFTVQSRVLFYSVHLFGENWMNSSHFTNKCSQIYGLWKLSLPWNQGNWGVDRQLLLITERGGAGLQCGVKRLGFNERARKRICSHKRRGKEKDVEREREKEIGSMWGGEPSGPVLTWELTWPYHYWLLRRIPDTSHVTTVMKAHSLIDLTQTLLTLLSISHLVREMLHKLSMTDTQTAPFHRHFPLTFVQFGSLDYRRKEITGSHLPSLLFLLQNR